MGDWVDTGGMKIGGRKFISIQEENLFSFRGGGGGGGEYLLDENHSY